MLNKALIAQNIKNLVQQKGMKLGDFESAAGVSTGYISRLIKADDPTSVPLMELLAHASNSFGVSIDTLISVNTSSMTPNETYLLNFLDKIFKDTQTGNLSWDMEEEATLTQHHGAHPHPLIIDVNGYQDPYFQYCSLFNYSNRMGAFSANTYLGTRFLYIIQVLTPQADFNESDGYEIYMSDIRKKNAEKVVLVKNGDALFATVHNIFKEASKAGNQIQITSNVKNTIDSYLNPPTIQEGDEDLPF